MAAIVSPPAPLRSIGVRSAPPPKTPDREADRRQVTVLFADLSGFTALAERLDPEEVRSFQSVLFEKLAEATVRYGGFVDKFMGDAVLAVFGAPLAHEDDPERALEAALEMLASGSELSAAWDARLGQPVVLHIAVHTGPVVAGSIGHAGGTAYEITGDTVNTASRLLGAAPPGTILVSEATYALTRHRFEFEPAGELALRGKSQRLPVHRLTRSRTEPQPARGLAAYGLASPMVGRAEELDRLLGAFDRMQEGRAQVVSLVGEAGAGKSRLIAEFFARLEADARLNRTAVRRVACSSLGEPTYGVFGALFREAYGVRSDDSLDVASTKLATDLRLRGAEAEVAEAVGPVLSYLLGLNPTHPADLGPELLRSQLLRAARTLLEQRLRQTPLLVLVEDLHWADVASLDLLQETIDHLSDRPLMVVVSHRLDASPLQVTDAEHTVVLLSPLQPEASRALVLGLFGAADETALALIQNLVESRAGGNPLFIEEIVRSLVSTGVLVRKGDCWTCTAACEEASVPPTLHGLLLSRIDGLPDSARAVVQAAAVLGLVFDEWLLIAVVKNAGIAAAALRYLAEADLIRRVDPERERKQHRFSHALVHEAVYQNLLLSRRTELHERAGRALERAVGREPERLSDLEALGHHWSLSKDKAKGASYLIAAGDWARALYANEDAIRCYRRALGTLAQLEGVACEVRAVRERLADVLALVGHRSEALEHYEILQQNFERDRDSSGAARVQRKIGVLYWEAGNRERAHSCFTLGLDLLRGRDGSIERAQLFQEMGRLEFQAGDNAEAIAWAERALAEAARSETTLQGDRIPETAVTRIHAYNTLGIALARTGLLREAVGKIEQSIGLAERHKLLQAACRGYTNLGVLYASLDPQRSIETCLLGLEAAKKVGDLAFQSRLYANLAVAYCALTDRCEADGMEAAQRAVELDRRLGLLDHLAVPLIVLGQIHQCHGDHDRAFASYREALSLAERVGDPQLLFPCYDGLATLYLDTGDPARAEAFLAKAHEVCERARLEPDALMVLPFLS